MLAIGRRPNTKGLGLEEAGVALGENGAIEVDAYSRTSVENVYAVGDVTDRVNLTPVALAEAMAFVDTVFRGVPRAMDHDCVASAVFGQPPAAVVGLTEAEARERVERVEIYRSSFRPLKHTLSGRDERAMMKLVVDGKTRRILGAHMVGPDAAEIVQGIAIAIKMGASKEQFDATVGIHPTAAEEFVTHAGAGAGAGEAGGGVGRSKAKRPASHPAPAKARLVGSPSLRSPLPGGEGGARRLAVGG